MWACGDGKENVFLIKHRAVRRDREAVLRNVSGHEWWQGYSLLCWFLLHFPHSLPIVSEHLSVVHEQTRLASVTKCSFFHPLLGAELFVQCNLVLVFFKKCVCYMFVKEKSKVYTLAQIGRFVMVLHSRGSSFHKLRPAPKQALFPAQTGFTFRRKKKIYYAWGVLTSQLNWSFKQCFKYARSRIMSHLNVRNVFFFCLNLSQSSMGSHQCSTKRLDELKVCVGQMNGSV